MPEDQEARKLLILELLRNKEYDALANVLAEDNSEEGKRAQELLKKQFIAQGEPDKALNFMEQIKSSGEKREDRNAQKTMSEFSDLLTGNVKGEFMGQLMAQLEQETEEITKQVQSDLENKAKQLKSTVDSRLNEGEKRLRKSIGEGFTQLAEELVENSKSEIETMAEDMFSDLVDRASVSEEDKKRLRDEAVESLKQTLPGMIEYYLNKKKTVAEEIEDLEELIESKIPNIDVKNIEIDWERIKNKPKISNAAVEGKGGAIQALEFLKDVDVSNLSKNAKGQYVLGSGGGSAGTWVAEEPTGAVDGVNTEYELSSEPTSESALVFTVNGQVQRPGEDFTISGTTVSLNFAPAGGTTFAQYPS